MKTVEFIFDFASPNAYLAHRAMAGMLERTGSEVSYNLCLLGGIFRATGNQAPMLAFSPIKGKWEYEQLEFQRFIAKHELADFTMNPHFPVNSLMLMRGAIVAEEEGRLTDYIEAGLHHMWEEPRKMDDPDTYAAAMAESGFDGAALLERTQDPAIKAKLAENTEAAVARGVFGIPTFFVGDEIFFGKDRLGQVEEALQAA